jgi:hypothetical protein
MNPTLLTLAVAALAYPAAPAWLTDYGAARRQAEQTGRPLVVVVGHGPAGWRQAVCDGGFGPNQIRLPREGYVCLYVDTAAPAGRKLASSFDLVAGGVVVSDRGGAVMAFHHPGPLTADQFARVLTRYANPALAVRATDTAPPSGRPGQTSTVPSRSTVTGPAPPSAIWCPTCRPPG